MSATLASMFADDRKIIGYRPVTRAITGTITASILLSQAAYLYERNGCKPFYKFKEPCKHRLYREGDSWSEDLGFTAREVTLSLQRIGTKVVKSKGQTAEKALSGEKVNHLIIYWTDKDRVTWYMVNMPLLNTFLEQAYMEKKLHDKMSDSPLGDKMLPNKMSVTVTDKMSHGVLSDKMSDSIYTENRLPTEISSKEEGATAPQPPTKNPRKKKSAMYINPDTGVSTQDIAFALDEEVGPNDLQIGRSRKGTLNQIGKRLAELGFTRDRAIDMWRMLHGWNDGPVHPQAFSASAAEWLEMMDENTHLAVRLVLIHQLKEQIPKRDRLKVGQREALKQIDCADKVALNQIINTGVCRGYRLTNIEWIVDFWKEGINDRRTSTNTDSGRGTAVAEWEYPDNPVILPTVGDGLRQLPSGND